MVNNHGVQMLLNLICLRADEKALSPGASSSELIFDKLVGQKCSKKFSQPPLAAAVLAAAVAAFPTRHRWQHSAASACSKSALACCRAARATIGSRFYRTLPPHMYVLSFGSGLWTACRMVVCVHLCAKCVSGLGAS